jgi:O-antigen/teichoic acid export membrane protein
MLASVKTRTVFFYLASPTSQSSLTIHNTTARSLLGSFRSIVAEGFLLAWLMADQAIFALTNFVTNILFARWLSPVDYGILAVSFSGYLLLTVLHHGGILEPLLVQSGRVDGGRLRSYVITLIIAHVILISGIGVLATLVSGVAWLFQTPDIALAILGAGIGGSFMVTLLTVRRLCLVFLSARVSTTIGIFYMAGVLVTTYLIHRYGHVTWFDLWLVMGAWSLLCSVVIFALLYASLRGTNPYTLAELFRFLWHYARYGTVASICSWARADGIMLILAQTAGLEAIAETRAVLNVSNPIVQVLYALQTSWLVAFSRDHRLTKLLKTAIVYCVGAGLMLAVVAEIYPPLIRWVYSGRYLHGAWLLPLYCLAHALNGAESVFTCFLKAIGSLRRGYAPQITGCIVSVILGFWLIPSMGQTGFIVAVLASFTAGAALACVLALLRR